MKQLSVFKSFHHAWRGLRLAFRAERNFRIQTAAAIFVLCLVILLPLAHSDRLALLIVTLIVLVLELLNTSLERLTDLLKPRLDDLAGDAKDVMAGAVLLASVFAVLIAFLILKPYLSSLLTAL